jgi:methylation protein EvaC
MSQSLTQSECKICGKKTKLVIDFGKMPIANGFINDLKAREFFYNLAIIFCPHCFMIQLKDTVKPEMMFNDEYQYISSTSQSMSTHFKNVAQEIINIVKNKKSPFIMELGCNDGIMLKHISRKKIKHLGIEPSGNVAQLARKNKVKVLVEFFNKISAKKIVKKYGQADVIYGANVFCHIEDINSVFEGINILLKPDGLVFFEEPYIARIIKKSSFDQIYDEHIYYYSGLSILNLALRHKLQLVDMKPLIAHGGSMRYYLKKGSTNIVSYRVKKCLAIEKQMKLDKLIGYQQFKYKINKICIDLKKLIKKIKQQNVNIVGYGATSKSTTLLNYAKIGPQSLDYICDTTPSKIGKFTPGTHIPIKAYKEFLKDKPSYTLLLAWNHKKEIFKKEKKYRQQGGKFITYFPNVKLE